MIRRILAAFAALFGVCFLASGVQAQSSGLMLTPLNHTVKAKVGSRQTVTFSFINSSPRPQVLDVQIVDLLQLPTGGADLRDAGTLPHSCAPWLSVPSTTIAVGARQTRTLPVNIAIPGDAAGSYHAAILVKLPEPVLPPGMTGGKVSVQTLLPIHVVIGGTEKPAAEVKKAELAPAEKVIPASSPAQAEELRGKWALVPTVENSGNSMVRVKGDIVVTSQTGALVGRYRVGDTGNNGQLILPGAAVSFPILINSTLPEAKYQARLNLAYTDKLGYSMPMGLLPRVGGDPAKGEIELGSVARTGLQAYVEPRVMISSALAGAVRTERVTVVNLEKFPITVTARASASTIDADGTPIILQDAAAPTSWLTLSPPSFRLGAEQTRTLVVRLMAPPDASDQWALLEFDFASASPKVDLTSTGRSVVLLRSAGNKDEAKVSLQSAALTSTPDGPVLSLAVTNPGARPAAFSASNVELTQGIAGGTEAGKLEPSKAESLNIGGETNVVVLPGKMRRLDFLLPKTIDAGQYLGRLKLNPTKLAGGRANAAEEAALEFKLNLAAPRVEKAGGSRTGGSRNGQGKTGQTPKGKAAGKPARPAAAKTARPVSKAAARR